MIQEPTEARESGTFRFDLNEFIEKIDPQFLTKQLITIRKNLFESIDYQLRLGSESQQGFSIELLQFLLCDLLTTFPNQINAIIYEGFINNEAISIFAERKEEQDLSSSDIQPQSVTYEEARSLSDMMRNKSIGYFPEM